MADSFIDNLPPRLPGAPFAAVRLGKAANSAAALGQGNRREERGFRWLCAFGVAATGVRRRVGGANVPLQRRTGRVLGSDCARGLANIIGVYDRLLTGPRH